VAATAPAPAAQTPSGEALAESILSQATGEPPKPVEDVDPEVAELEKGSLNDNFKKLKTRHVETKNTLKAKEQELEETRTKLTKYESGEVLPDALKAQSARIQELEKYEKIYNLEKSPEYSQKFIKPLEEIKGKLDTFAKAYNVPPDELAQIIDIDDISEANAYLSERFDDLSALQIRQLVDSAQSIKHQMNAAKREPETVLTQLVEEGKVIEQQRVAETNNKIGSAVKSSWSRSIQRIRQEGFATELIARDNDTEHNQKFVEPILNKAAEEHGKIISSLVKAGMREIPDELSDALARQSLLAHASATAIASRDYITKKYAELEANTRRSNTFRRPSVGSNFNGPGSNGGAPREQQKPLTPESMAVQLRQQVTGQK
jgi:hypothetical protein